MTKMYRIWFNNVSSFDEIFIQIGARRTWHHRRSAKITSWFRTGIDTTCLEVRPTEILFQMMDERVIAIDNDEISFESIDLNDGTSLIKATHLRMSNSHDIAIIETRTIPGFEWRQNNDKGVNYHEQI